MAKQLKLEMIYITAILIHYGFDLEGNHPQNLINKWIKEYDPHWIRYALLEALYQGRYKAVSVEQLLWGWKRRGRTVYHFNREFERLICRKFPESLTQKIAAEFIFSYPSPEIIPEEPPATAKLSAPIVMTNFQEESLVTPPEEILTTNHPTTTIIEPEQNPEANDTSSSVETFAPSVLEPVILPPPIVQPIVQQPKEQIEPQPIYLPQMAEKPPERENYINNNINNNEDNNEDSNLINLEDLFSDDYADEIAVINPYTEIKTKMIDSSEIGKKPIDQFIPEDNQSQFYLKLKSLAEGGNNYNSDN